MHGQAKYTSRKELDVRIHWMTTLLLTDQQN